MGRDLSLDCFSLLSYSSFTLKLGFIAAGLYQRDLHHHLCRPIDAAVAADIIAAGRTAVSSGCCHQQVVLGHRLTSPLTSCCFVLLAIALSTLSSSQRFATPLFPSPLEKALSAGGYNVSHNNSRVNRTARQLVKASLLVHIVEDGFGSAESCYPPPPSFLLAFPLPHQQWL